METLTFYVVRNQEGKYLRSKGYSGYGDSWVTDLNKAKVYTKKQSATGQITYWATHYPSYGIPELVPLNCTLGEPIDQTKRVTDVKRKKEIDNLKQSLYRSQRVLDEAIRDFEHSKKSDFKGKMISAQIKIDEIEEKLKQLTEKK